MEFPAPPDCYCPWCGSKMRAKVRSFISYKFETGEKTISPLVDYFCPRLIHRLPLLGPEVNGCYQNNQWQVSHHQGD